MSINTAYYPAVVEYTDHCPACGHFLALGQQCSCRRVGTCKDCGHVHSCITEREFKLRERVAELEAEIASFRGAHASK